MDRASQSDRIAVKRRERETTVMINIDDPIQAVLHEMRTGQFACDYGVHPDRMEEYIQLMKEQYPGIHYCVISHWVWNEVEFPENQRERLKAIGCKPHFLYSRNILGDTEERGFSSVLTSLQTGFFRNAIFRTQSRLYLLVGPGRRNVLSYEAYIAVTGRPYFVPWCGPARIQ